MKVLASDFDNTLFFHKGNKSFFNEKDIEKIKEFQAAGNLFGLCTGRALFDVLFDTKDAITFDFYILVSGAIILDKDQMSLHKATIPFDVIKDMYLYFKHKNDYSPVFSTEKTFACIVHNPFPNFDMDIYSDINDLSNLEFVSTSYILDNEECASALCKELNTRYKGVLTGYQNTNSVDIVASGNSKGTGILFLKEHLGIDKIYGIGDSYNDIPMLEKVDVPFTFPSSPALVKQKAAYLVNDIAEAISIIEKDV